MAREKIKDLEKGKVKGQKGREQPEQEKPKKEQVGRPAEKAVRTIIRVVNTDLDGDKSLERSLSEIVGIGAVTSKAICTISGLDPHTKLVSLNPSQIEKLEQVIKDPIKFGLPVFMANRRFDPATGKDLHLTGQDFDATVKFDVKREIDTKSYRGWRHMLGQPVRGQETRSHYRQKGRAVGVMRTSIKLQAKPVAPAAGAAPSPEAAKKEGKK